MALVFSKVNLKSIDNNLEFLVGGIPKCKEDLENWIAFENFIKDLDANENVEVFTKTYRYGEEENNDATPEEVAYFMERIKMRADFIETRTEKLSEGTFSFKIS